MRSSIFCILLLIITSCIKQPSTLFLEAESFDHHGGWVVDAQFIDQMGSSYLMAHGLGIPVKNAATRFVADKPGNYHVYVRTFNWTEPFDVPGAPGRFRLKINNSFLDTVFGTRGKEWHWQYGGAVRLEAGEHNLSLHDLTGFNARMDAIVFSTSRESPPNDPSDLTSYRKEQPGLPEEPEKAGTFDLVVVGGGISGICAAVSAARSGLRVALIQNRPVLGGNNSSEIRVHLMGKLSENKYPALGAVVHELDAGDPGNSGPAEAYGDDLKLQVVENEKNLELFLNTHVYRAHTKNGHIESVVGVHTQTGKELLFEGSYFADCTGDGNLGFMAGADYRYGREGEKETGESMAPEEGDSMTMGTSNLWFASKKDTFSGFPETPWALQMTDEYHIDETRADWRWESGFKDHTVEEAESIRDHNLRAIYGNWSYLKNKKPEEYGQWSLDWVAHVAGKRESRRLMGDLILSGQDVMNGVEYPDAAVTATWGIDLHHPDSLNSAYFPGEEFYSWYNHPRHEPYEIPYRCLYSRNIDNLFMAGRCISVTHVALGTVRVMRTGGMLGEVVGMAAAIAAKHNTNPRGLYEEHLEELITAMEQGVGSKKLKLNKPRS